MEKRAKLPKTEWYDLAEIDAALEVAYRELMLEHAKLGRSVHESHNGVIVEITPTELFARFGLDENGKPLPKAADEHAASPEAAI